MAETHTKYSTAAILLHWVTAVLMIIMLLFGEDLMKVPRGQSLAGWQPSAHASMGFLILLLTLARLFWRFGNSAPPLPQTMASWEKMVSHINHWALYGLLILVPLLGLLALVPYGSQHTGVELVTFFNLFPLAFMPNLGGWTLEAHEIASKLIEILVILHVLAALKHQLWNKDGLLRRMSPF